MKKMLRERKKIIEHLQIYMMIKKHMKDHDPARNVPWEEIKKHQRGNTENKIGSIAVIDF